MLNLSSEIESAIRTGVCAIIYSGFFMAIACSSQEFEVKSNAQVIKTPPVQVSNTPVVEDSLEQKAIRLTELFDNKNCKQFFYSFPNTFEEFASIYRFDGKKGGDVLYSKYPDHFSYFFACSEVANREKVNKVIAIGVESKWDEAVPIGEFGELAFDLIKDNSNTTKELLDSLPDDKAASFWYFLFDRPHPTDKENSKKVDILRNALGKNSKQSKLLSEQYKKLVVDWSEH